MGVNGLPSGGIPNLITSGKSQHVIIDGVPFSIEIYPLEQRKTWRLQVVDHEGTSHIWNDQFVFDKGVRNTAIQAIEVEGAIEFIRGDKVNPQFRKNRSSVGSGQPL